MYASMGGEMLFNISANLHFQLPLHFPWVCKGVSGDARET